MKTIHTRKALMIREETELSQVAVANEIGVDRSLISHFESGRAAMSAKRLQRLAALYTERLKRTVTIDELLAQEPAPQKGD